MLSQKLSALSIKDRSLENMEMDFQRSQENANTLNNKIESEINERAIVALRESVKAAITINGAAAVAILGFMGGVAAKNASGTQLKIPPLQGPLLVFAFGVLMAAAAYIPLHYFEERAMEIFQKARQDRNFDASIEKNRNKKISVCFVALSLLAFTAGCVYAAALL
jgi:hypothetical protein